MIGRIRFAAPLTFLLLGLAVWQAAEANRHRSKTDPRRRKPPNRSNSFAWFATRRPAAGARDGRRPLCLHDAGRPFSVDLIGCIHIADKKYYDSINDRFKQYGAVLFELVMPEGQSLAHLGRRKSNHPIARIQQSLPKILDLAYQLQDVDYTAKNLVHADLSPDQMAKAIKARGDSGASVFIKILFDLFRESNRQSEARDKRGGDFGDLQLLAALFDPNRPLALKRLMADQMELMDSGTGLGPTLDTILVQDRNGAAMKVLAQEIKKGTHKIAIF